MIDNGIERKRARQREATRRYRLRHPERVRESAAAWREANPEKQAAYTRASYAKHREKRLDDARVWRAENPEKVYARNHAPGKREARRAAIARWRADNPELARAQNAERESRRRAQMRGTREIEKIDRSAIIARDRQMCHLCGKRVPKSQIQLDHLVPLALGGPHTAANLAVAHGSCNARKWINPANDQLRLLG